MRRRLVAVMTEDLDESIGQAQRGLHRIGQATAIVEAHDKPVDDDGHVVVLAAIERRRVGELHLVTVDDGPHEALLARILEQFLELPLAAAHQRREHFDARAIGPSEQDVGDLPRTLPFYRARAVGAVRRTGARIEQPQVVVDLGDGADRRPRVVAGGLLLNGNGRRQPLDGVDVGLLHQAQELAGVRGKRLDVAALAFGEDGVEGERRLARSRQPGHDGQAIPGNRDVDVLQVVLAGAADDEGFVGHRPIKMAAGSPRWELGIRATRGPAVGRPRDTPARLFLSSPTFGAS